MSHHENELFNASVWRPALERFGAVTHLTVTLYDVHKRIVCCEPVVPTSLFAVFRQYKHAPSILLECAQACLAQGGDRPAVVVTPNFGIGVVGTSLVLDGQIVGAAVAGFALVDFCQSTAVASLARQAGIPFRRLWQVAQQIQPIPQRRLALHGELLQVLGDTILRENHRTRQLEQTAAQLQKEAAAKDEFLAVLSHELRTPLTPILGWARILRDTGGNAESRRRAADSIERNALLQLRLVDDLLDLNRVAQGKIVLETAAHDLSTLLRTAIDTVSETAASRQIRVASVEGNAALSVEGDAARLQQIFVNVLSNAVKFTPANGDVRVETQSAGGVAIVRIRDNGEGIPEEFLPHVFEMFRQQEEGTRRRHGGLGIGLALVKRLVELQGGQIAIASHGVGRGTEVTIRLPLAQKPLHARDGRVSESNRPYPFANVRVLVVEDMEDNLEMMRNMLEMLGANVLIARNGLEALDVTGTADPDVVLCDLRMPQMDGFEFLEELSRREGTEHRPVVAVTGLTGEGVRERTRAAGFQGHLSKPFDDMTLSAAVRTALVRRKTA